ncbi:hypothetical protein OsI_19726 [Oryza sativa Indica Group]|uniref:Uncharacterized protein n=1 Tax=Oryza sativa subsp. indica TaxID=39946 RepID=B8AXP0_ORYSI|nr:hypothetical protein OsI_19726 [Oryza sativa Indica Group]
MSGDQRTTEQLHLHQPAVATSGARQLHGLPRVVDVQHLELHGLLLLVILVAVVFLVFRHNGVDGREGSGTRVRRLSPPAAACVGGLRGCGSGRHRAGSPFSPSPQRTHRAGRRMEEVVAVLWLV